MDMAAMENCRLGSKRDDKALETTSRPLSHRKFKNRDVLNKNNQSIVSQKWNRDGMEYFKVVLLTWILMAIQFGRSKHVVWIRPITRQNRLQK